LSYCFAVVRHSLPMVDLFSVCLVEKVGVDACRRIVTLN
jgi:hypothetical protein